MLKSGKSLLADNIIMDDMRAPPTIPHPAALISAIMIPSAVSPSPRTPWGGAYAPLASSPPTSAVADAWQPPSALFSQPVGWQRLVVPARFARRLVEPETPKKRLRRFLGDERKADEW